MIASSSLLIRNGRVITASDDVVADILVEDGQVAQIGMDLTAPGADELDATGLYVLPGGVDPHTHVRTGDGDLDTCDGFTTGTASAACGGTTTIVDFCFQPRGQSFAAALDTWHRRLAEEPPLVDVGFHLAVTDLEAGGGTAALASVIDGGVTSLKLFMAYREALMLDDGDIFRVMRCAGENGAIVMLHAENGDLIETLVADALERGEVEPRSHTLTRPMMAEAEATHRAIELAGLAGCPLYVVHVTCAGALQHIQRARLRGGAVWGETCPQYLLVAEEDATRPGLAWEQAARYVYSPPARPAAQQDELWRGLVNKTLSVVSTDHNPFRLEQKLAGQDFAHIPNGAPGVETRLVLLHEFGVRSGRFDLNRLVELTATNPAKLFGLYPRKGTIAPGADADLVVFDPEFETTISASTQQTNADYSLFEGTRVTGAPRHVFLRGRQIVENGQLVGEPGVGQFLARARMGQQLEPRAQDSPTAL
jgi:dihydropyrimidinase